MREHPEGHWLPVDTYVAAIERETRRFREVLAQAPTGTAVPGCPEWDVDDLLWHLGGEVQAFWAWVIANRPLPPTEFEEPDRPDSRAGLLAILDRVHEALMLRLRNADPSEGAWSWTSDPDLHTVAFTMRRQAHEALIHRIDAELAVGERTPVDPALAADGFAECLEVMYAGLPSWGSFEADVTRIVVEATDTGHRLVLGLGRFTGHDPRNGEDVDADDLHVVGHGHVGEVVEEPDLWIRGTAELLDTWVWHRAGLAEQETDGDEEVAERLRAILSQSID